MVVYIDLYNSTFKKKKIKLGLINTVKNTVHYELTMLKGTLLSSF